MQSFLDLILDVYSEFNVTTYIINWLAILSAYDTENTTSYYRIHLNPLQNHRGIFVCVLCVYRLCVMACCSKCSLLFISVNLHVRNKLIWWARNSIELLGLSSYGETWFQLHYLLMVPSLTKSNSLSAQFDISWKRF